MPGLIKPVDLAELVRMAYHSSGDRLVAMTDEEFLGYFVAGLDIDGHRVAARIGSLAAHRAVEASLPSTNPRQFIIQVDHGADIPVAFDPDEDLASRMKRVDAAVARWVLLRP